MCGIIAVVRRRAERTPPEPDLILALVAPAADSLAALAAADDPGGFEVGLAAAAEPLEEADRLLRGVPGVQCLLGAPTLPKVVETHLGRASDALAGIEAVLDRATQLEPAALEQVNSLLVRVKDAVWAIGRDRLRTAVEVGDLAGPHPSLAAVEALTSVQVALSAIDRLEVRGRDSAGLHLLVRNHGLDLADPGIAALFAGRSEDLLFRSGAVRLADGHLGFVYKASAEIGELGDNTRVLRSAIASDDLLALALEHPEAEVTVLGHTRWASVGIISQANAHPLDATETDERPAPYVVGALNGDVDNFADLQVAESLRIAAEITCDAKVIPTLVSRRLAEGDRLEEAFRRTVASFEGSVAIGASAASEPADLLLALRGSGQALYVGLAEDSYVVASEPYGLVEETDRYIRVDGETPANPDNPTASRGQLLRLRGELAGSLQGIVRLSYDGTPLPVTDGDVALAQITTRDIDRGDNPHFLLKEISEAPASFRKTLRGKLIEDGGALQVRLGPETLPVKVSSGLAGGHIRRVTIIGQGTAHVAGQSLAAVLAQAVAGLPLQVEALPATELSGFQLRPDMSDTLVIAISQSGTTTDTNRTVDLVRGRGAQVVAIVNRRNSDLCDKADGVLYTSDGRDVEMSVASTKAFYAQIAAGILLATAVAEAIGGRVDPTMLAALRELPDRLAEVVSRRAHIAAAAHQFCPPRRYWAIVGNGSNRVAAAELRIKLSELCYKSIACDATEDKKHIDLSSEPLILVCAAGLTGSNADDVAKEVAIYRAHKASPIVIVTESEERFSAAVAVLRVPATHPQLAFVLSAMAGHLFGYEAALAIDAQALPLREARSAIEESLSGAGPSMDPDAAFASPAALGTGSGFAGLGSGDRLLRSLRPTFAPLAARFFDGLRAGSYDGHLEASTAVRLASLWRYALAVLPLDSYQIEYGKVGTPAVVLDDFTAALTRAIEELTRPIDAIKHQAKTVTVGISRTDETLLQVPLVAAVLEAGAPRDSLTYRTLRTLADLDPAVATVTGWIRYRVEGDPESDQALAIPVDRAGIAAGIPSRADRDPVLRGTKHTVAVEKQVFVTRGRNDGRTLVIVPETKDSQATGITLLHVAFHDSLPVASARAVLQGYRNRFAALKDAVSETEGTFREDLLTGVPVADLLVLPIRDLADRWRA